MRERMVAEQLVDRGISDPRVLDAMRKVPRHLFVRQSDRSWSYEDHPLPIGKNQTISQPYIVAVMTEQLGLEEGDKVLDVGTGSGYQAALLGKIAKEVHSVERIEALAQGARNRMNELGYSNVQVHLGDGSQGWPDEAPYDAILVAASSPGVPRPLLEQLAEGGRLVLPVAKPSGQVLQRWRRVGEEFESEDVTLVAFVPLIGKHGWSG